MQLGFIESFGIRHLSVASRDGFGRCPPAPEKGWSQSLVVNLRASHLPEGQARAISKFY
jgi:hypothetical protein